jgi:hypothetical protein
MPKSSFDVVNEEATHVLEPRPVRHPEEIQRIEVDPEDRLAFRVGVNILTLVLIGLLVWFAWPYLRG